MALRRLPLGRSSDFSGRQRVYEAREALEVDEFEAYAGQRRRVFYDEVLMVTYHQRVGWPFVVVLLALSGIVSVWVLILWFIDWRQTSVILALLGLAPLLGAAVLRMTLKLDVVTAYGKRSQARVQFWVGKARARQVYQRICARARQAQERAVRA